MSQVDGPAGSPQFSPEEVKQYQQEYQKSFDLFQNALQEYDKPNLEEHKKQKFKTVMDEALEVMNQTACVALTQGKQGREIELEKSYQTFIQSPSQENRMALSEAIKNLG